MESMYARFMRAFGKVLRQNGGRQSGPGSIKFIALCSSDMRELYDELTNRGIVSESYEEFQRDSTPPMKADDTVPLGKVLFEME